MYEERYNTHNHNINKSGKIQSNKKYEVITFDHSLFEYEVTKDLPFWQ